MSDLLIEIQDKICFLTLNRVNKQNAFDDKLLALMQTSLDAAIANKDVRVIVLKANGRNFSAGADLEWMQRMATFSEQENLADALVLAKVMYTIYHSPKPTIAMIQGAAYGGGAGLAAACDIAVAATTATFCFSEVKLGLIPAVISPYVVKAIGERASKALFMTASSFTAEKALALGLVQHCVTEEELTPFTLDLAVKLTKMPPGAVTDSKNLVDLVANQPVSNELLHETASIIAKRRVSEEGQKGLHAFLNKETPVWN